MDEPGRVQRPAAEGAGGSAAVVLTDPEARLDGPAREWLWENASAALGLLGAAGEVRVRVVGDEEMAAAHEQYMGEAGTTDVLTFDMTEAGSPLDVDIMVCMDEAMRQARPRGHAPERELLLYVVHGVLHCLGHDDHEPEQARAMHAEEDRVLETLGVGTTYGRPAGDEAGPGGGA